MPQKVDAFLMKVAVKSTTPVPNTAVDHSASTSGHVAFHRAMS